MFCSGWRDHVPGQFFLITFTPPGANVMPWDESQCTHAPDGFHSGRRGCRVDAAAAAAWNRTCTKRFSHAMTDIRRRFDPRAQYSKANEVQRRGLMHLHVIVRTTTDLLRVCREIAAIAQAYEFGPECDVKLCDQGASWYLAKYAAKTADERQWVPWPDRDGVVTLGAPRMRAWSTSRGWGLTMKELRALQAAWWDEQSKAGPAGQPAERPATGRAGVACPAPQAPGSALDSYTESSAGMGSLGGGGAT